MDYFFDAASFLSHLKAKNRSKRTIESYIFYVNRFFELVRARPGQVSEHAIRRYITKTFESGRFKTNSIKMMIRSLKVFYKFLYESGQILCNPAENLTEPKSVRRIHPFVLSPESMESIRKTVKGDTLFKRRDRAIIEVLYATGLRKSELASLDISDVDPDGCRLFVRHGKGGKQRIAVLSEDAVKAIETYLRHRMECTDKTKALWINRFGARLSKQWIWKMLKQAAKAAEVTGPTNPHAWRHGIATSMIKRGASITDVQHFLGHATAKSTQIYTHIDTKNLQTIHSLTHPREDDPLPETFFPLNRSLRS